MGRYLTTRSMCPEMPDLWAHHSEVHLLQDIRGLLVILVALVIWLIGFNTNTMQFQVKPSGEVGVKTLRHHVNIHPVQVLDGAWSAHMTTIEIEDWVQLCFLQTGESCVRELSSIWSDKANFCLIWQKLSAEKMHSFVTQTDPSDLYLLKTFCGLHPESVIWASWSPLSPLWCQPHRDLGAVKVRPSSRNVNNAFLDQWEPFRTLICLQFLKELNMFVFCFLSKRLCSDWTTGACEVKARKVKYLGPNQDVCQLTFFDPKTFHIKQIKQEIHLSGMFCSHFWSLVRCRGCFQEWCWCQLWLCLCPTKSPKDLQLAVYPVLQTGKWRSWLCRQLLHKCKQICWMCQLWCEWSLVWLGMYSVQVHGSCSSSCAPQVHCCQLHYDGQLWCVAIWPALVCSEEHSGCTFVLAGFHPNWTPEMKTSHPQLVI